MKVFIVYDWVMEEVLAVFDTEEKAKSFVGLDYDRMIIEKEVE